MRGTMLAGQILDKFVELDSFFYKCNRQKARFCHFKKRNL